MWFGYALYVTGRSIEVSNTMWKAFEREIATWFSTVRNMGSGRINSNDDGEARPGDVVMPQELSTLIECKTRKSFPKSGIFYRAEDTLIEAEQENLKNWFHLERKNGSKKIYILATNAEWMELICNYIRTELDRRTNGKHI